MNGAGRSEVTGEDANAAQGGFPTPRPPTRRQRLARRVLAAFGWRVEIAWPAVPRAIVIVYPHTSNWDFVVGYLAKVAAGLPAQWIGKDSLFRWPFGALLRRMGGIPVNRRASTGFVAQLAREAERRPWMWIALAPEGTRAHGDHWKSGFYHLALAARMPVGLAFIDWREKLVALREYATMTGDEAADLARLRAAYAGRTGKRPDQASPIRFRS